MLIWGTVLSYGGKTKPKLYWTTLHVEQKPRQYTPLAEAEFRLPEVFWEDLSRILQLLVAERDAEFQADQGRYVADRLPPFINRVRTLLKESTERQGWNADERYSTRMILANALMVFGEQSGKKEPLEEAVLAYREALKERTRERVPLNWATTQNNLGAALVRLGERESGTKRLEEAVLAYQGALSVFKKEQAAYYISGTMKNIQEVDNLIQQRKSGK